MSVAANQVPLIDFVIVWRNGKMSSCTGQYLSHMFDLSDCDAMEDVAAVYAVNESNELVKVRLGKLSRQDHDDNDHSIIYATSKIMAGNKQVGTVHWSDH